MAHLGAKTALPIMAARVVWLAMAWAIKEWVGDCSRATCSRATSSHHPVDLSPAAAILPHACGPSGPLCRHPERGTYQYLFTIIDRPKRWLEAVPLLASMWSGEVRS